MFYLYSIPKVHKKKSRFIAGVGKSFLPTQHGNVQQGAVMEVEEEEDNDEDTVSLVDNESENTEPLENPRVRRDREVVAQRHVAKMHKPQCSTTAASKELSKQLNMIIDLLREKDSLNEDFKRCFITRKAEEVFDMIKSNQYVFDQMQPTTYDFTTLYTKLPLNKIVENMQIAITEAMEYKTTAQQQQGRNGEIMAKYATLKSTEELMDYVNFIVNNTFIANSVNEVYRQQVGIPMGTNCAPEIANLVLYVWESRYIDVLRNSNRMDIVYSHKYTKRFIDDIICFNAQAFPQEAYEGLEYSQQTHPDGSVNFLGAKFHNYQQRFRISVFDKAKEWPVKVIRYPSENSNTPQHQAKGIYIGELRRYQLMVNSLTAFKEATSTLTRNMYMRGYDMKLMKHSWRSFMNKYGFYFSKMKRKDLAFWYWRMLKWACQSNPRRTIRRRQFHHHHQQVLNVPQLQHPLPFNQPNLEVHGVINGEEHNVFEDGFPDGNGDDGGHFDFNIDNGNNHGNGNDNGNGNVNGNGNMIGHDHGNGNGNVGHDNGNGNMVGQNMENNGIHHQPNEGGVQQLYDLALINAEVTFEQARARMEDIRNLADNAKIGLYLLNEHLRPPVMFDDPTDNTELWTEELIADHGTNITINRHHLSNAVNNIKSRINSRRTRASGTTAVPVDEMTEIDLHNVHFKWYCVYCWQRYYRASHTSKICREGRLLRKLATFSHQNNGDQLPPEAQIVD